MRALILGLCLALLSATVAVADGPPSLATTAATIRSGANCAIQKYPASAIQKGEQGSTVISVLVDEKGNPKNVTVIASSGFNDLDQAATACVRDQWHFNPATANGKTVEASKQYRIVWKLTDDRIRPRLASDMATACFGTLSSADAAASAGKSVMLQYRVTPNGLVEDAFVASSSKDSAFDDFAVQCVSGLHYLPATQEDIPVGTSWGAQIVGAGEKGFQFGDGHGVWHICSDDSYPAGLLTGRTEDVTVIAFHAIGGRATDTVVEQSSGNTDIDRVALACIQQWNYRGPQFDGPKADFKLRARITWRHGHVYVLETPA